MVKDRPMRVSRNPNRFSERATRSACVVGWAITEPDRAVNGIDVRPRGIDWRTEQVDAEAMAEWRRAYKTLAPARQMLVATIITLYCGEPDKTWLARLPSTWHAADAIAALLGAGAQRYWARLVALYPGVVSGGNEGFR
jgi:hypothetical protein